MTTDTVACASPPPLLPVGGDPLSALDPCASDPMVSREARESSLLPERRFRLPDAALEEGVAPAKKVVKLSSIQEKREKDQQ